MLSVSVKSQLHKQHIWFFADTKAKAKKTKRAVSCQRTARQVDNYSNIIYIEKRDIEK